MKKKNETNEYIIKFLKYKNIPFKDGNSFEILNDKKLDTYKIVLFFISPKFINDNISQFLNLKQSFQINKLNHYIFYFENKKFEDDFNAYQAFTQFNFKYTNNIKELEKIIIDLFKNIKQNELYKKYIQLIEDELFYKFIIDKYLYLFNKSIYSKPKKFKKNELLFIKISQDLQFLKNFEFNENIFLAEEIINEIKAINNNNDIKKIIDGFIGYSNIILDIKHILIEFENNIDDKIRINGEKTNNDNVAGNIHNIDNDKNNKNEKNSNNSKCKVEIINSDDYFDLKRKKTINLNKFQNLNNLAENIKQCSEMLEKKKTNTEKEKVKEKIIDQNFILLISQIEDNLKIKIKNELMIILYLNLQKSIAHLFEKEFIKNYLKLLNN